MSKATINRKLLQIIKHSRVPEKKKRGKRNFAQKFWKCATFWIYFFFGALSYYFILVFFFYSLQLCNSPSHIFSHIYPKKFGITQKINFVRIERMEMHLSSLFDLFDLFEFISERNLIYWKSLKVMCQPHGCRSGDAL